MVLRLAAAVLVLVMVPPSIAQAENWVLEPSIALDQRLDDNYRLYESNKDSVAATRLVGSLGLSRRSETQQFEGLARIDGLLTQGDNDIEDLSSNQILFLNSNWNQARFQYGFGVSYRRDTPNRDISADITDISATAADTGASNTQEYNQPRTRIMLTPSLAYDLTRRSNVRFGLHYTDVSHGLASVQELLAARYIAIYQRENLGESPDSIPDNLTIDDVNGGFAVPNELEDYTESGINAQFQHRYSPLTTLKASIGFAHYTAQVDPDPGVWSETSRDPRLPDIQYKLKRDSISETSSVRLGLDRRVSETLTIGVEIGGYSTWLDESDLVREDDNFGPGPDAQDPDNPDRDLQAEAREARMAELAPSTKTGALFALTASKDAGNTRFSGRMGVDVFPSDTGSQVESFQAVGDLAHKLSPLLDFNFRVRAYEPDAISAVGDDEYARRFLSFEPRLTWQVTRAWTAAAAYRYRRQKSQTALQSSESNALLFTIKWTPPSEIRDTAGN